MHTAAVVLTLALALTHATAQDGGCLYDGRVYSKGEQIMIQPCLALMTCEGDNNYSTPISLGGVCPEKATRDVDGQSGCWFDGRVYGKGDTIIIQPCLAAMTCLGDNSYSEFTQLGGQC